MGNQEKTLSQTFSVHHQFIYSKNSGINIKYSIKSKIKKFCRRKMVITILK